MVELQLQPWPQLLASHVHNNYRCMRSVTSSLDVRRGEFVRLIAIASVLKVSSQVLRGRTSAYWRSEGGRASASALASASRFTRP